MKLRVVKSVLLFMMVFQVTALANEVHFTKEEKDIEITCDMDITVADTGEDSGLDVTSEYSVFGSAVYTRVNAPFATKISLTLSGIYDGELKENLFVYDRYALEKDDSFWTFTGYSASGQDNLSWFASQDEDENAIRSSFWSYLGIVELVESLVEDAKPDAIERGDCYILSDQVDFFDLIEASGNLWADEEVRERYNKSVVDRVNSLKSIISGAVVDVEVGVCKEDGLLRYVRFSMHDTDLENPETNLDTVDVTFAFDYADVTVELPEKALQEAKVFEKEETEYQEDTVKIAENSVNAHSEAEMAAYAETCLAEKYGKQFEIEEENRIYSHQDGDENKPMSLRAYAHPLGDNEDRCFIVATETDGVKDNYFINAYQKAVSEQIGSEMEKSHLRAKIEIDYPAKVTPLPENLSVDEVIHDSECIIFFEAMTEAKDNLQDYIPLVREWMDFLYGLDYRWYLEIRDEDNPSILYFTLDPGDNNFTCSDDWSDELIIRYIASNRSATYQ